MEERLAKILRERCELQPGERLVLGVSGGPDSLCLLDLIVRLGYSPVVAHFDHRLRPGSAQDGEQVRAWAETMKLSFNLGSQDVPAHAAAHSQSLEEAARETRYRFLFETARRVAARAVVVGHTADDQVETVLMHLLRGSGLAGLRGMPLRALPNPWSDEIGLIRPLLGCWREEVLDYCAARGLQPLTDPSNQDTSFFRNRLRHELIPYLETFNPEFKRSLVRTAQLAQGDYELIQSRVQKVWQACLLEAGPGFVALKLEELAHQPAAMQRYLIRQAASLLRPGLRDIGFEAVERVVEYLGNPDRPAQIDWTAGLRLVSEPGRLWLADWRAELPSGDWPVFPGGLEQGIIPGQVIHLSGGWELQTEMVGDLAAARQLAGNNPDPFQAWLSLDGEETNFVLRSRREGDRIQPLGMPDGTLKVSDLMINLKLPQRARAGWPVVVLDNRVAWVPGCRTSHEFRLTPATRQAVHLRLARAGSTPLI